MYYHDKVITSIFHLLVLITCPMYCHFNLSVLSNPLTPFLTICLTLFFISHFTSPCLHSRLSPSLLLSHPSLPPF